MSGDPDSTAPETSSNTKASPRETLIPEAPAPEPPETLVPEPTAPEPAPPESTPPLPPEPPLVEPRSAPPKQRVSDPFAAAREALEAAAAARGVSTSPLLPRSVSTGDPFAAAERALALAKEARRPSGPSASEALATAMAEAQLRRLRERLPSDEDE